MCFAPGALPVQCIIRTPLRSLLVQRHTHTDGEKEPREEPPLPSLCSHSHPHDGIFHFRIQPMSEPSAMSRYLVGSASPPPLPPPPPPPPPFTHTLKGRVLSDAFLWDMAEWYSRGNSTFVYAACMSRQLRTNIMQIFSGIFKNVNTENIKSEI